jgi:hypothetical protein
VSEAGDTSTDTGQAADSGTEGQDGGHLEALTSRMDEMASKLGGIDELRDLMQQDQYDDDYGDDDGYDDGLYDEYGQPLDDDLYDDDVDPEDTQEAQKALQKLIAQQNQPLQQQLQAVTEQLEDMRIRGEANDIAREIPDLDKPEVAKATMEAAQRHAQQLGMPELASEPAFLKMTYLAGRAEVQAQQETPAGGHDGVRVEGAGGTPMNLTDAETEYGDRIVGSGPKSIFG